MNDDNTLLEASFHITVVTYTPSGRRLGYFATGVLELSPQRFALLKRLAGDQTWKRSRGFKDVPWSDVERSVAQVFEASRRPERRKASESKVKREGRRS